MEAKLTDLEVRYTHQQRLLDELSGVVYEQSRTIAKLEARVTDLERRLRGVEEPIGNEPPPHY
ncbi:MAG: SlyX family protein [Polyangiaceae bacterium]